MSLSRIFEKTGYEADTAETGNEALEKVKERFYNLALLDIRLPDLEGVELLKPLRQVHPDMAMIMVTGHATKENAMRALNEGASAYVTKPVDMDVVLATIKEALDKQRLKWENKRLLEEVQGELKERKRAEAALQESEAQFRAIFENAALGAALVDLKGKPLRINPALQRMLGYTEKELQSMSFTEYTHPSDIEAEAALFRELMGGKRSENQIEKRYIPRDGHRLWARVTYSTAGESTDKPKFLVALVEDITERKQMEEALLESEAKYSALVERAREGIIIAQDGILAYTNQACADLLGYSLEELSGMSFMETLALESREAAAGRYSSRLSGDEVPERQEYRALRKDGTTRDIEAAAGMIQYKGEPAVMAVFHDITERKQAEEALRRERDNLTNILEAMKDPVYIVGQAYDVEYANQALLSTFGLAEGKKCYELFHGRQEPCTFCRIEDVVSGETVRWEWYSFKDQKTYDIIETALKNADGSTSKMTILRDITNRKRMEEELLRHRFNLEELVSERTIELSRANKRLHQEITERTRMEREIRESEERFRAIAEATPIPIMITRLSDGVVLYANNCVGPVFGLLPEEIIGRQAPDFYFDPTDRQAVVDSFQADGHVDDLEVHVKRADGTPFWVIVSLQPLTYSGEPAVLSGFNDVTRLKEADETLRESEEKWRSVTENSPDYIMTLDRDANIIFVNRTMPDQNKEAVVGTPVYTYVPEEYRQAMKDCFERVFNTGKPDGYDVIYVSADGNDQLFEARVGPIWQAGEIVGLTASSTDITERRLADLKMQELYEQEKELRQSLEGEMTKRVEFTRALAHELKTPLTPVMMSSQALAAQLKEEPLASLARNVSRGASNLDARIDELLDLAKGEIGMLQLRPRSVNMRQLLEEAIEDVASLASSRGQTLVTELPPSLPQIHADEVRSRQIVMNLLNNALKFTPEGGHVLVRAREDESSLIVEVEDTGPGIPKKDQQRIFDPYHRRESDRERLSGLGLGLALCKSLVELHGGEIWVRSRPGKGSTFGFSLPLDAAN